jgi:hypothetical protein
MSSFILPLDHIGYLVNLGYQLEIRSVYDEHCNLAQRLNLAGSNDRRFVTGELLAANIASILARNGSQHREVSDVPKIAFPELPFTDLNQFVQALQWIRCYQYQSCNAPNWTTTFAYQYTQGLRTELETKIIGCFATSWLYNGASLSLHIADDSTLESGHQEERCPPLACRPTVSSVDEPNLSSKR